MTQTKPHVVALVGILTLTPVVAYAAEGCGTTVTECRIKQQIEELQRQLKEQQATLSSVQQGPCTSLRNMTITEWTDCVNKYLGEQQVKNQALKTQVDTQQQQMGKLQAENQALKTQVEQLSQQRPNQTPTTTTENPNQTLPATTENCTSEATGQIRFDGTYARLCNGTHWQVMEARHPKPVLKPSAKTYTIAEIQATAAENEYGQGTVCETGYHLCIFMEALVLKHAYPRSRIPFDGNDYLRTLGNYSSVNNVGNTSSHNALLGYKDWNGPSLQCPEGSGPMLHFYNRDSRNTGAEWDGGCHKDDKRLWACCINNLD